VRPLAMQPFNGQSSKGSTIQQRQTSSVRENGIWHKNLRLARVVIYGGAFEILFFGMCIHPYSLR